MRNNQLGRKDDCGDIFLCGFMLYYTQKIISLARMVSSGMAKIKKHACILSFKILKYQQIQKEKRLLGLEEIRLILTIR
jgi:hypothetical protein